MAGQWGGVSFCRIHGVHNVNLEYTIPLISCSIALFTSKGQRLRKFRGVF